MTTQLSTDPLETGREDPPGVSDRPGRRYLRPYGTKSPVLSGILSLMPGLGQIYVGYYKKGFLHILVVAVILTILASDRLVPLIPLFALFMGFFWLYNVIDAARMASLYNLALEGGEAPRMPEDLDWPRLGGSIAAGSLMILAGCLLLLNTAFGISMAWLEDWWPVALIVPGAWLLWKGIEERRGKGTGTASPDGESGARG